MKEAFIEIKESKEKGYHPLVDFENWRVAVLNEDKAFHPDTIPFLERHNETDEIFVLLKGNCILYFCEKEQEEIKGILLERGKIYNVKKGCWHNAALNEDGSVLIVENANTTYENSDVFSISCKQREDLIEIGKKLSFG